MTTLRLALLGLCGSASICFYALAIHHIAVLGTAAASGWVHQLGPDAFAAPL